MSRHATNRRAPLLTVYAALFLSLFICRSSSSFFIPSIVMASAVSLPAIYARLVSPAFCR